MVGEAAFRLKTLKSYGGGGEGAGSSRGILLHEVFRSCCRRQQESRFM